jgi:hypothetical protein
MGIRVRNRTSPCVDLVFFSCTLELFVLKKEVVINVVKHVNRIRIGRRVIVRNSDNRNTNRKILPK